MDKPSEQLERRALLASSGGNLVIGIVGIVFAVFSSSQAILLDGLFNLIYLATGLFTLKVARLVQQGDDEHFPMGYGFFEPLINGLKGMLVLGLSIMAVADAVQALFAGGRMISPGLATLYGIFASLAGWTIAAVTHRGATRTGSPLVKADAENWIVNGAISSAVLLAFVGIFLLQNTRFDYIIPYVDPGLVVIVGLISLSVPVRMAWQALMELLNRAPSREIVQQVEAVIRQSTASLPVQDLFIRVVQPGRTRMVLAHVILPEDYRLEGLSEFDALRVDTLKQLQASHPATMVDLVFTADPQWGAMTRGSN